MNTYGELLFLVQLNYITKGRMSQIEVGSEFWVNINLGPLLPYITVSTTEPLDHISPLPQVRFRYYNHIFTTRLRHIKEEKTKNETECIQQIFS